MFYLVLLTLFSTAVTAEVIVVGDTYPVREQSMQSVIEEKVSQVDLKSTLSQYTESYHRGFDIPYARRDKTRRYTPWYENEFELKDPDGEVLFPRHFRFNPLERIILPYRILFFDYTQLDWAKAYAKTTDKLILTKGDVWEAREFLGAKVYLLDPRTHSRLKIQAIPSIYHQRQADCQAMDIVCQQQGPDDFFTVTEFVYETDS